MYSLILCYGEMYSNSRDTVPNVEASDSRRICISKIIAMDLRLVVRELDQMALARPRSGAAVTI